jgi:inorganic pyrophosphatase
MANSKRSDPSAKTDRPVTVNHFRPHPWHGLEVGSAPHVLIERLEHYFLTYKLVPGLEAKASIERIYGQKHALRVVRAAMADYKEKFR